MVKKYLCPILLGLIICSNIKTQDSDTSYWSYYENLRDGHYNPLILTAAGASFITAAVLETCHWIKRRRESEYEICIRAEKFLQEMNVLDGNLVMAREVLARTHLSLEEKLEQVYTYCNVDVLLKSFSIYQQQVSEIQLKLTEKMASTDSGEIPEKLMNLLKEIESTYKQVFDAGILLLSNQDYFHIKNALKVCNELFEKASKSTQVSHVIEQLTKFNRYLEPYPALANEVAQANAQLHQLYQRVQQKEKDEKVKDLLQFIEKKLSNFNREISEDITPQHVEQWVVASQLKTQGKYRYIQYVQLLQNAVNTIEKSFNELQQLTQSSDSTILQRFNKLKAIQQFINSDVEFVKQYNYDLDMQRHDNLEQERLNTLKEQVRLEERARQEQIDLERRKVRAVEEKARLEGEKVREIIRQTKAEEERKKVCEKSAQEERKRAEAENRKAQALEEQNRIEREKLNQSYNPQVDPSPSVYPDLFPPSAPPME